MTELTEAGAEAGEYEAAPEIVAEQVATEGEGSPEAAETPEQEAKPPLPPEELTKRLQDQKAALREERARRREEAERAAKLEARLAEIEANLQQRTAYDDRPDPSVDPHGWVNWAAARIDEMDTAKQTEAQKAQEEQRKKAEVQSLVSRMGEYEADFRDEHPDYDQAAAFLGQSRYNELIEFGYAPQQAQQTVRQELISLTQTAMQAGKNPAEAAYKMAQSRGFAGNKAQSKLETIAQGQKAATSLSSAGGTGKGDLSIESVNNLKGAAFLAAAKALEEKMLRQERGF